MERKAYLELGVRVGRWIEFIYAAVKDGVFLFPAFGFIAIPPMRPSFPLKRPGFVLCDRISRKKSEKKRYLSVVNNNNNNNIKNKRKKDLCFLHRRGVNLPDGARTRARDLLRLPSFQRTGFLATEGGRGVAKVCGPLWRYIC